MSGQGCYLPRSLTLNLTLNPHVRARLRSAQVERDVVNARRVESDKRGDDAERKLQEAERRLGIKVEIHFEP